MIYHSAFKNPCVLNIAEQQYHKQLSDLGDSLDEVSDDDFEVELKMRASKKSVLDSTMVSAYDNFDPRLAQNGQPMDLAAILPRVFGAEVFHFAHHYEAPVCQEEDREPRQDPRRCKGESPVLYKRATSMRPQLSASRINPPLGIKHSGFKRVSGENSSEELDLQMAIGQPLQVRGREPDASSASHGVVHNISHYHEPQNNILQLKQCPLDGHFRYQAPQPIQDSYEMEPVGYVLGVSPEANPANLKSDLPVIVVPEPKTVPEQENLHHASSIRQVVAQDSELDHREEHRSPRSISSIEEEGIYKEDSLEQRTPSSESVLGPCCPGRAVFYINELFQQWKEHLPEYYKVIRNRRVVNSRVHYKMRSIEEDLKELAQDSNLGQELACMQQEMEVRKLQQKNQ